MEGNTIDVVKGIDGILDLFLNCYNYETTRAQFIKLKLQGHEKEVNYKDQKWLLAWFFKCLGNCLRIIHVCTYIYIYILNTNVFVHFLIIWKVMC